MNIKEFNKKSLFQYMTGLVSGITISYLAYKIKKMIFKKKTDESTSEKSSREEDLEEMSIEAQKKLLEDKDEVALVREQLKRNYEFFGEEGMKDISNSFVVVVGIGGVGSHAVMTLIRSGVSKIRVIDYDIVTLSSLNRHAFAFRSDVGKLKVRVVKEYAIRINPNLVIETVDDAFVYEYANRYILKGNPDYVVDCIDDLEAKCELLKFCNDNKLRVISSMGAGAKMDPTCIKISDFQYVHGDKLAKRMRYIYKKKFLEQIPNFKTIYSTEKSTIGLSELEEHQKENPEIYRINENERVRSLPVFASIPAIFGQAIASAVLCDLAKMPFEAVQEDKSKTLTTSDEMIGNVSVKKLYDEFRKEELNNDNKKNNMIEESSSDFELIYEDFVHIARMFKNTSSVSQKSGYKIRFYKWISTKPSTVDNIVLLTKSEFNKHLYLRTEEDLLKLYGEETFNRISQKLKMSKDGDKHAKK